MSKTKSKAKPQTKKASKAAKIKKVAAAPKVKSKAIKAAVKDDKRVTKSSIILDALKQENGATVDELATAASWQKHSVRGFLSTLASKKGVAIDKFTRDDGKMAYKIEQPETANDK